MLKRRGVSLKGVYKKPKFLYGVGTRTGVKSSLPKVPRVWAMRKVNWVEFRASPDRPLRKISRILVGDQTLSAYSMKGGEFLGTAKYRTPIRLSETWFYMPEMRDGELIEVGEAYAPELLKKIGLED